MLRLAYTVDLELKDENKADQFMAALTALAESYDPQADVMEDSCEDLDEDKDEE